MTGTLIVGIIAGFLIGVLFTIVAFIAITLYAYSGKDAFSNRHEAMDSAANVAEKLYDFMN